MKRVKLFFYALGFIAFAAAVSGCNFLVKNDFKKIAAPGKYEGVHTNGVKYEFYFTDTSAYKVIITLTDSSKVIYYGKGEAKDDGFRATGNLREKV